MTDPLAPAIVVVVGAGSLAYLALSGKAARSRAAWGLLFAYGVAVTFAGVFLVVTFHVHELALPGASEPLRHMVLHVHGIHEALEDASTLDVGLFVLGASTFVYAAAFGLNQMCFRRVAARAESRVDSDETVRLAAMAPGGARVVVTRDSEPSAFCFALLARGPGRLMPISREYLVLTSGLTRAMDDGMLRAVVAHEWAHVAARDSRYLPVVRAARRLVFFDPMFRWMERRLEAEREFAADRAAVAQTGDPLALARALLRALEVGVQPRAAGCGLVGAGGSSLIIRRIERLLSMAGVSP